MARCVYINVRFSFFFFFQAEDGIRDYKVTGVQTCALPISGGFVSGDIESLFNWESRVWSLGPSISLPIFAGGRNIANVNRSRAVYDEEIGRASCRERV